MNAELSAAVSAVNAAYVAIPETYRPDVADWTALDRRVDRACASGNSQRALDAIGEWRDAHLSKFAAIYREAT